MSNSLNATGILSFIRKICFVQRVKFIVLVFLGGGKVKTLKTIL